MEFVEIAPSQARCEPVRELLRCSRYAKQTALHRLDGAAEQGVSITYTQHNISKACGVYCTSVRVY